jgi:ribonucleotide reductase beta subunit family protein with ferritin-like domain
MATVEQRPPRPAPAAGALSYADLYARWERGSWSATQLDFGQDAIDWRERLTPVQRRSALWMYALFFHGEDAVTDTLSPILDAAPREEQTYVLATQQADEARHSVFFHRFLREVVGAGAGDVGSTLAATAPELTWGHRQVFARLERTARELRADPSPLGLARAVTLYHIVVEASLAQPGQHFIEDALERMDVLPAFRAGLRRVALDEQRHIALGVKLLSDLYAEHGEPVADAVAAVLREVLPWTSAVIAPPGWDRSYTESFGVTLEELGEAGARSLEQKLRAAGFDVTALRTGLAWEATPAERADRGQRLLRANLIGPGGPIDAAPEHVALLFDGMRRSANARAVPAGTTIQWDFTDHQAWHLVLAPGATRAAPGPAADPDLRLRASLADFADVSAGRADARRLLLRGRLRPRGDLRLLARLPKVFD